MKTQIVIGASAAGIGALIGLRQHDKESKIICISEQDSLPYNKCLLADFICQRVEKDRLFSKDLDFFKKNNIELLLSKKVEKILPDQNQIVLKGVPFESFDRLRTNGAELRKDPFVVTIRQAHDLRSLDSELNGPVPSIFEGSNHTNGYSQILKYDNLFLGLGTSAFIPPIPGTEKIKDIFTFHTLSDARKILNFIKENKVKHATIIGAGLSGVELSDTLTSIDIKVNLIEQGDRVLVGQVDEKGSELIENTLVKNKVNVYKNSAVQKIEEHFSGDKKIFNVEFVSGEKLKTEMIIFVIGAKPNTEIANAAGIKLENGRILTNDKMQTNISNIFAGGDVCLVKDMISGKFVPSCTWPDATMQGMVAGVNMSGISQIYQGVLSTVSSRIFDLPFVSCGQVNNIPQSAKVDVKLGENFYHKFVIIDSRLIGFLMVGNLQDVGKLKNCIMKKESFVL